MKHSRIAAITILSLITLAICCQMLPTAHAHDAMQAIPQSAAHLALLATNLPAPILMLAFLIIAASLLVGTFTDRGLLTFISVPAYCSRPPDNIFATPLRLAFADGILHSKRY